MKSLFFIGTCVFLLSACSSKQLYNAAQQNRQSHCFSLPPAEKAICEENLNKKSYEDYQADREAVMKTPSKK